MTVCPLDAVNKEGLLEGADLALYEVKNSGRNGFKHYDSSMRESISEKATLYDTLLKAFDNQEFFVCYQPIFNLETNKIFGLEAFTRWRHPLLGVQTASEFMESIKLFGLEDRLTEFTVNQVCKDYQYWQRSGVKSYSVSINMSQPQFLSKRVVDVFKAANLKYQTGLSWMRVDIDEASLANDPVNSLSTINELVELGILCNIDHFGQGFLSLKQLTALKIKAIKFGCTTFVDEKVSSSDLLIALIKSIGNIMGVPCITTNVETDADLKLVKSAGIKVAQGEFLCEPLSKDSLKNFVSE